MKDTITIETTFAIIERVIEVIYKTSENNTKCDVTEI